MERTPPQQLRPVPLQLHPEAQHQPLQRHFFLEPLDFVAGDACHENGLLRKNPSTASRVLAYTDTSVLLTPFFLEEAL
jgi:hypothetical protein